jgi:hypothetical protein
MAEPVQSGRQYHVPNWTIDNDCDECARRELYVLQPILDQQNTLSQHVIRDDTISQYNGWLLRTHASMKHNQVGKARGCECRQHLFTQL